ncbi:nucleotidyl transferase AbiEii/AbiGii toxin family protein [Enterocloster aldenensis]|uniref:nucleotidyl transferase AbiEii/AbiGii toxin family protein n=1 Tax=Enterocloster aldenensis TaxID=358742 RepID=UPI004026F1BD
MAVKDMAASILTRLKTQAKETGLTYQMCLQLFCQEEFLRKIEASRYSENFILKGGMFLYTITEFASRPTRDIDFMIRWISNDTENMNQIMEEICTANTGNDFIRIEVLASENITEEKEYHGVKTKFRAYIKNVKIPFSIDVGVNDVIVPGAVKRTVSTRLDGFHPPTIYTYSLESTIAEKFDAIIKRMEATSRMKDFFDIYYLSGVFDFEGRKLQEAIFRTLEYRGTIYESDSFERIRDFKNNTSLLKLWDNYQSGTRGDKPDFNVVIDRLEKFLEPIFHAVIMEEEWFCIWDSSVQKWLPGSEKP